MGVSNLVTPSASALKTLGLSITSTNTSITSLPTNKSITAVIIGGGGSASGISSQGSTAGAGSPAGGSGFVKEVTFVLTSSVTASATIGAGGAGVGITTTTGNNGGNTTLIIPGIVNITALGGQAGSDGIGQSGSGGGTGGFGGGGGNTNGLPGAPGCLLGQKPSFARGATSSTRYYSASQNILQDTWTFPTSSATGNSNIVYTPNWVPPQFSLTPGVGISVYNDPIGSSTTQINTVSASAGTGGNNYIQLTTNYSGTTTSVTGIGYATQDSFSVLPNTYDLLTRANIRIPGGGGGGGGGNFQTTTVSAGGIGAGTGGAGGTGGYSNQSSNNIRATHGTAGAQPGGGGGGTGGYGYSTLSGPASGDTAAGGNGAVYFFWVA